MSKKAVSPAVARYKKAAGVVESYLASLGSPVKFRQALDVVAKAHGVPNWNVLQGTAAREGAADTTLTTGPEAPKAAPSLTCKKCDSDLDGQGYCTDVTCPHNDWPQSVPAEAWGAALRTEDIARRYGARKRLRVTAEVHSEDRKFEVEFDAAAWFVQASDDAILKLAAIGWTGDYISDEVAEHFEETNTDISDMLAYCRRMEARGDDGSFECSVEEDDAMAWLSANRPGLWARLLCKDNEVHLVQAETGETQGKWDWLDEDGSASGTGFGTIEEAALAAVRELDLSLELDSFGPAPSPHVFLESPAAKVVRLYELIRGADLYRYGDSPLLTSVGDAPLTGDPDNEVFYVSWSADGYEYSDSITEADLATATINFTGDLQWPDPDADGGMARLMLYRLARLFPPA